MKRFWLWLKSKIESRGNWHEAIAPVALKPKAAVKSFALYDSDEITKSFQQPVKSPVLALVEALKKNEADIEEAYLLTGRFNEQGGLLRESGISPTYKIVTVHGKEAFLDAWEKAEQTWKGLAHKTSIAHEAVKKALSAIQDLREDFVDKNSLVDGVTTTADPAQWTEYTPIMGGPFYRQLYLFDHLRSIALAFEAYHHNPIAKRIPEILTDFTVGRGFKIVSKDTNYQNEVENVVEALGLDYKVPMWSDEEAIYGELMIDTNKWENIDPSTVWQIVHEPDDVNKEIYFFQSYPTDYMTHTGYKIPGQPGAEKIPSMKYIIRQIPASQVIHLKSNCVSNEVRGRSIYFPIHGWLKMAKDLLEAEIVRAKLQASFVFDDLVKGSDADVLAHANAYTGMPPVASVFAHNEAIDRKPMAIMAQGAMGYNSGTFAAILSVIATNTGIPADYFNIQSRGGSRATAIVSSDPFNKVIERRQIKFRNLILSILKIALPRAGVPFSKDAIEIVFPSVSKDTTSDVIKNIVTCETQGYISKRTAGAMAASQLDIVEYDYQVEQQTMKADLASGLDQVGAPPAPPARVGGGGGGIDQPYSQPPDDGNDIHGPAADDLRKALGSL